MELTSKDGFRKRKIKAVSVGGDDTAYIRVMSGKERDAWRKDVTKYVEANSYTCEDVFCGLLVYTLCDKDGNRLFKDGEASDLNNADSQLLETLYEESFAFNKLGVEGKDEEKKD